MSGRGDRGGGGVAALSPPGVVADEVVGRGHAPVSTLVGGTGKGGWGSGLARMGQLGWTAG